jgi:hypothetical protein
MNRKWELTPYAIKYGVYEMRSLIFKTKNKLVYVTVKENENKMKATLFYFDHNNKKYKTISEFDAYNLHEAWHYGEIYWKMTKLAKE